MRIVRLAEQSQTCMASKLELTLGLELPRRTIRLSKHPCWARRTRPRGMGLGFRPMLAALPPISGASMRTTPPTTSAVTHDLLDTQIQSLLRRQHIKQRQQ